MRLRKGKEVIEIVGEAGEVKRCCERVTDVATEEFNVNIFTVKLDENLNEKLLRLKKEIMNKLKSFEETELLHRYDVEKIIEEVFSKKQ